MDQRIGKMIFGISVFGATLIGSSFLNPAFAEGLGVGKITGNYVNVRTQGSLSGSVIARLNWNDTVTVLDKENGWYKIKLSDGREGWVFGEYLSVRSSSNTSRGEVDRSLVDKLIDFAKSFVGTPYVYGGATPKGFDCSGFVQYVFKNYGFDLPRTANEQATVGEKVSYDSLVRGDLVFFTTLGSSVINHVGIYIGNGEFINSSSGRGKVIISPLDEGYYKEHYVTARRIIK